MIAGLPKGTHRTPSVRATCDACGSQHEFTCDYSNGPQPKPMTGQAMRRLTAHGWTGTDKSLRCPSCTQAKRQQREQIKQEELPVKAEAPPATVAPIRQPSREQKRQIIELLNEVYDVKAERYKGDETDVTVANTIGPEVMFGWVAQLREEMFGPDGGNEEIESLLADMKRMMDVGSAMVKEAEGRTAAFKEALVKIGAMAHRLEAIKQAVGPKAARL